MDKLVQHLKTTVKQADYLLNTTTYQQVRRLFTACATNPELHTHLQRLAPEFGRPEYLLCVDKQGVAAPLPHDTLADFHALVQQSPEFETWFQTATPDQDARPLLLPARWLCHLTGFRHRTVHLFIDHPTRQDCTLIQVRGLHRPTYPGCFDTPVAGHVVGLQPVQEALFKELGEELGLEADDIADPEINGRYDYAESSEAAGWCNVEYRIVYTSRIVEGRLANIKFADGEVAALSIFDVGQVEEMLRRFPERVASGLRESWSVYLGVKEELR